MYIYKAAVIGAGQMGSGIAQVISYSGIPCLLKDVSDSALDKGMAYIKSVYGGRVQKGKMTPEDAAAKVALVTPVKDFSQFNDVDIVVEAIFEDLEIKKQTFRDLDKACNENAILGSNTSSLPISALASVTKRPDKVIGLHFFFPATVMKLIEIIPGLQTSMEVVDSCVSFCESLRKIPVKVKECPGFLVNRLLTPYLYEAVRCVEDGLATPKQVDEALVKFGMPMGPFLLVDNVGLDICYHVAGVMYEGYGSRFAPPKLIDTLYKQKRFGRKSGAGIFRYDGQPDDIESVIAALGIQKGKGEFRVERIIYTMLNEAAYCLEENVATPSDLDTSLLAGIGFPLATGGLLRWADNVGIDRIYSEMRQLEKDCGERFHPSTYIQRLVSAGFYGVKTKRGFFEYT